MLAPRLDEIFPRPEVATAKEERQAIDDGTGCPRTPRAHLRLLVPVAHPPPINKSRHPLACRL